MNEAKRKKLEKAGWAVGSAAEFLGLTEAEEMIIGMKMALANKVQKQRKQLGLTQSELAKRIGSSQSRVAKVEVADNSVSMELLVRSLASMGASRQEIAEVLSEGSTQKAAPSRQRSKAVKAKRTSVKT